jgi:peptide/nickel transport system substrate-binding protein
MSSSRPKVLAVGALSVALTMLASGSPAWSSSKATSAVHYTSVSPTAKGTLSSLTWDLPFGEPTTLDYAQSADYGPDMVVSNLCESLLRLNPDFSISPNLATSWVYGANHMSLTFTLRSDVKFWDGQPLTTADVVYSMLRNLNPKVNPVNGAFYMNVKSIVASGPHQVVVNFTHPDELFIKEMATISGDVVEKAFTAAKGSNFGTSKGGVMCSGPYQLNAWHAGTNIVLTANPHYWNSALQPKAKKVTIDFITDTSILTSALKSGEIDGAFEVPSSTLPALQSSGAGSVYIGPSLALYDLSPIKPGPATDPKIRQALSMVIDRAALAHQIFHDAATPNYTLIPKPTGWDPTGLAIYQQAWNALPKQLSPAVAAAKALIKGDPNAKKSITIGTLATNQNDVDTVTLIQQEAAQIGLRVVVKQMQPLQLSSAFFVAADRKGLDFLLTAGYLDVRDPLDYLGLIVFPTSIFNFIGYHNARVIADLQNAQSTFDNAARAKLFTHAQALYEADHIVVPLLNLKEVVFMKKGITGATTSFAYIYEPNLATVGAVG